MRPIILATSALLLAACAAPAPACDLEAGPRAYEAKDIGQEWVDYVWVEIPFPSDGNAPTRTRQGRLFVASADPVGAIVPTMIDLPCAGAPVEYSPAPVEFEFTNGRFKTSYSWGSCARCSDCYMHWTFSLDVDGQLQQGALVADLVLNETFHSGPMKIVSVRMEDVTSKCSEPRLRCETDGKCEETRYVGRAE